jgi:hypothetical protein
LYNENGVVNKPYPYFYLEEVKDELEACGIFYEYEDWSYRFKNVHGNISEWMQVPKLAPFLEGLLAGLSQSPSKETLKKLFTTIETKSKNKDW